MSQAANYVQLTNTQAHYLNRVSETALNYRKACQEISEGAMRDLQEMQDGFKPHGPYHQRLFEMQMYYGKLMGLIENVWDIFPLAQDFTGQMLTDARAEVDGFLKEALAEDTSKFSFGAKYFMAYEKENA